jgi:hypothetical protein
MSIFDRLAAPFDPSLVSWRAQTMSGDGKSAMALCYIDARDVMNRLDEVCGPDGWQDRYVETVKGRLLCTITVRCGDDWIEKSDGAGDTDVEGEKGAISDAFKRAAVKWGIGRYLYDVPATWADCDYMTDREGKMKTTGNGKPIFKCWAPAGHRKLAKVLTDHFGAPVARKVDTPTKPAPNPQAPITDEQRTWLQTQCEKYGGTAQDICEHFNVTSFKELVFGQLTEAKTWLETRKKAA